MIRLEAVDDMNARFSEGRSIKEYVEAFRREEPFLFSWMGIHAKSAIDLLSRGRKAPDSKAITVLYDSICRAYLFTYHLMHRNRDLLVERLTKEDQFEGFLAGNLDDRFYQYDTAGMDPESDLVKAKEAHLRVAMQTLRKRLIPLIAEDVSRGHTTEEVLRRIDAGRNLRDAA